MAGNPQETWLRKQRIIRPARVAVIACGIVGAVAFGMTFLFAQSGGHLWQVFEGVGVGLILLMAVGIVCLFPLFRCPNCERFLGPRHWPHKLGCHCYYCGWSPE